MPPMDRDANHCHRNVCTDSMIRLPCSKLHFVAEDSFSDVCVVGTVGCHMQVWGFTAKLYLIFTKLFATFY